MSNQQVLYTAEEWRSQRVVRRKVPQQIFSYTLQDIIQKLWGSSTRILNFHELYFYLIFTTEGWTVHTLPFNRQHPTIRYLLAVLEDEFQIDSSALCAKGCPDFLLTKLEKEEKLYKFIEVKVSEKALSKYQIAWTQRFPYEFSIVKPVPRDINRKNGKAIIIKRNRIWR